MGDDESTMSKYKNFPLDECAALVERLLSEGPPGPAFFQKWTCGGCGARLTGGTPNKLFVEGHCEDCGHVTDIRKAGCNYAIHYAVGGLASVPPKGNA